MKSVWLTRFLPAFLGVVSLSLVADTLRAELVFSGVNFDIVASSPVDVGVTPLKSVTLTAIGKNGALPNTFDGTNSGTGGTGITTAESLLHQVWQFSGVSPTPTLTLIGSDPAFPMDLDTHFLNFSADLLQAIAPTENKLIADTTEDPGAGFGDYLTGTFVLDAGLETSTWDFAQIVVPAGTRVFLDFEIGAPGYTSETVGGSLVVPEPSTPLLLTLGALALMLGRRRRRR